MPESAAFPIVADPHFDWGIISGTLYFNKNESKVFATLAGAAAVCGLLTPIPGAGPFLAAACATEWAWWVALANIAKVQKKCVKIKVGLDFPEMYTYSGGYCNTK